MLEIYVVDKNFLSPPTFSGVLMVDFSFYLAWSMYSVLLNMLDGNLLFFNMLDENLLT